MILHFNLLLRQIFLRKLRIAIEQIGFEPPDENWRKYVGGLQRRAINIYLADLRENREMRTNEGLRQMRDGMVSELPPPRWLDCHYLITAWDPAAPDIAHGVEPTLAEHVILTAVASCLLELETEKLTPRLIYEQEPLPSEFPSALADAAIPFTILPGEGFPKLAEFWGAMGAGNRWKPAVYLVAALPLIRTEVPVGFQVTTLAPALGQRLDEPTEK